MKNLFSNLLIISMFLVLVSQADPAYPKKITRHCKARYEVALPSSLDYAIEFGHFKAKGGCGASVRNRCRARAKERAQACMMKHWESKLRDPCPRECTSSNSVFGYHAGLVRQLQTAACNQLTNRIGEVEFTVLRVTHGDKGCGPGDGKKKRRTLGNIYLYCEDRKGK